MPTFSGTKSEKKLGYPKRSLLTLKKWLYLAATYFSFGVPVYTETREEQLKKTPF